MSIDGPSLAEKVVAIDEALTAAGIDHAFGGALALAYYAVPRVTVDVDVNVFVAVEEALTVAAALAPLGVDDAWAIDPRLADAGQARAAWGPNPVDLFFAYDAIHDDMAERARRVPFGETTIPILAPEHLLACKVIFDRRKDWIDIEQMLLAADDLDVAAARHWVERIVGAEDGRLQRLDRAVRDVVGE